MSAALKRRSAEQFLANISITPTCWLWLGSKDDEGYALFSTQRVSRLMLERKLKRPIGPGLFACHTCDVTSCVKPSHLYEGTAKQNANDREVRGRGADVRGENNPSAQLTAALVLTCRQRHAEGETSAALAREFGMGKQGMHDVITGRNWSHLP